MQLAHLEQVCEVQMTEPIRAIPSSFSQRIVNLIHTLWPQLHENEWFFVAPVFDVLTVLCVKHEPMDVTLSGTGRLQLKPMCKAYGGRMFIQSHATIASHNTGNYVLPPYLWRTIVVTIWDRNLI